MALERKPEMKYGNLSLNQLINQKYLLGISHISEELKPQQWTSQSPCSWRAYIPVLQVVEVIAMQ